MRTSEQIQEICAAIVAAQAEMPAVPKTATNPHFRNKYAPLDAIVKATAPVLAKHGLAVIQGGNGGAEGRVCITTRIVHTSGQFIESDLWMRPGKDDPQGVGACVTYGSRYGYRMLGVITDEDDDGNAASDAGDAKPAAKAGGSKPKAKPAPKDDPTQDMAAFLEHMQKAKAHVGDATYYAVLKLFAAKHANEITKPEHRAKALEDLRRAAKAKKEAA